MHGFFSRHLGFQLPMSDYLATFVASGLVGTAVLPSLVYGINSTLVFITLRLLWKGRTADTRKRTLQMTCYIAFICVLCTAHWVLSCVAEALALVQLAEPSVNISPIDPLHWTENNVALAVSIIYTILTWLTDGLLVRVDIQLDRFFTN